MDRRGIIIFIKDKKDALTEAEASITKIASGDIFLTEAEIFSLRRLKPL